MVKNSPLGSSLMLVSPSPDLTAGCILFSVHSAGAESLKPKSDSFALRSACLTLLSIQALAPPLEQGQVCWDLRSQNTSCPGFILCPSQLAPSSFFSSKLAQKIHLLHPSKKWRQSPLPSCSSLYKKETSGATQNDLHTGTL